MTDSIGSPTQPSWKPPVQLTPVTPDSPAPDSTTSAVDSTVEALARVGDVAALQSPKPGTSKLKLEVMERIVAEVQAQVGAEADTHVGAGAAEAMPNEVLEIDAAVPTAATGGGATLSTSVFRPQR